MKNRAGYSKYPSITQINTILTHIDKLNSGNGLSSSNSNLFVFKNGWTTTNKENNMSGPGIFKSRPQSSNNYVRRQRNMANGTDKRVWKYHQSNNELTPGI